MLDLIKILITGAVISGLCTTAFLYLMSPFLMGAAAPASAQRFVELFIKPRPRVTLIIVTRQHLVAASAALVMAPIVVGDISSPHMFAASHSESGTMASGSIKVL